MPFEKGKPRAAGAGRRKGTPNRATLARQEEIAKSGLTPLEFMLSAMRDENNGYEMRLDAAKAAAPYVHPRLAAIEHSGPGGGPMQFAHLTDEQLDAEIRRTDAEINEGRETEEESQESSTLHLD